MRFRLGPPLDSLSVEHLADPQWRPLRQLHVLAMQLLALPVGAAVACMLLTAWIILWPSLVDDISDHSLGAMLIVLVTGMPLQLLMHPGWSLTRRSTLGFWLSRVLVYTAYDGHLSGRRFVWLNLLPFVVLTLAPLCLSWASDVRSGWLVFVSCIGGFFYGLNAVMAGWAASQLPSEAEIGNIGFKLYWRPKV